MRVSDLFDDVETFAPRVSPHDRTDLVKEITKIESAADVLPLVVDIASKSQEHFVCLTLNGANELIERRIVTIGLLDRSEIHSREVFADVIADRAAEVIFAHNIRQAISSQVKQI